MLSDMLMLSTAALLQQAHSGGDCPRTLLVVGNPTEWLTPSRTVLGGDARLNVLGVVESGAEALALVSNLQPDIVLVDMDTPDMSAFELARQLSGMARTGRTVIAGPQDGLHWRYRAQAAGASGYIAKQQLNPDRILSLIC